MSFQHKSFSHDNWSYRFQHICIQSRKGEKFPTMTQFASFELYYISSREKNNKIVEKKKLKLVTMTKWEIYEIRGALSVCIIVCAFMKQFWLSFEHEGRGKIKRQTTMMFNNIQWDRTDEIILWLARWARKIFVNLIYQC